MLKIASFVTTAGRTLLLAGTVSAAFVLTACSTAPSTAAGAPAQGSAPSAVATSSPLTPGPGGAPLEGRSVVGVKVDVPVDAGAVVRLAAAEVAPATASAKVPVVALKHFSMPSGNIACQDDGHEPTVECWLKTTDFVPAGRPASCAKADWGHLVVLQAASSKPSATFYCNPGNFFPTGYPTLQYGQMNLGMVATCVSQPSGLVCASQLGRSSLGFQLNRSGLRVVTHLK